MCPLYPERSLQNRQRGVSRIPNDSGTRKHPVVRDPGLGIRPRGHALSTSIMALELENAKVLS